MPTVARRSEGRFIGGRCAFLTLRRMIAMRWPSAPPEKNRAELLIGISILNSPHSPLIHLAIRLPTAETAIKINGQRNHLYNSPIFVLSMRVRCAKAPLPRCSYRLWDPSFAGQVVERVAVRGDLINLGLCFLNCGIKPGSFRQRHRDRYLDHSSNPPHYEKLRIQYRRNNLPQRVTTCVRNG
jgi:hypothetical protein